MINLSELKITRTLYDECVKRLAGSFYGYRNNKPLSEWGNLFYLAGLDDKNIIRDMVYMDTYSNANLSDVNGMDTVGCASFRSIGADILNDAAVQLYQKELIPAGIIKLLIYNGSPDDNGLWWLHTPTDSSFVLTFGLVMLRSGTYGYYTAITIDDYRRYLHISNKTTGEIITLSDILTIGGGYASKASPLPEKEEFTKWIPIK